MSDQKLVVVAAEDAFGFDGEVSAQFGRCPFFLLAEASGTMATVSRVVPNPYRGEELAGAVPRFVHEMGADVIIAGGMEPSAMEMLHGFGIDVATGASGSIVTVLGAYLRGEHRGVVASAHHRRAARRARGERLGEDHG
jgi:predicted Fe-Mo cluster-binding NifX family protein